jgi:hypothetical protein
MQPEPQKIAFYSCLVIDNENSISDLWHVKHIGKIEQRGL